MPLRWGELREPYDPDADVGLPRPFILETKVKKPRVNHSLRQPKDPAKVSPLQPKPDLPPKPTFFTLPHLRDKYRNLKDLKGVLGTLTAKDIKGLEKSKVALVIGSTTVYITVDRIIGENQKAGYYVRYTGKVKGVTTTLFKRVPSGTLDMGERIWDSQRALERYAVFLYRYARSSYWDFKDKFEAWRDAKLDAWQRQSHEADAQYQQYVKQWKAWLRKERERQKQLRW